MIHYFRVRGVHIAVMLVVVFNAAFIALMRPIVVSHPTELLVFGAAVPLQCIVVMSIAPALSSRMETFEQTGVRQLWAMRATTVTILTISGATSALILGFVSTMTLGYDAGTVGPYAPVRAFLGMWGVALALGAFVDVRIAGLFSVPFGVLPAAADTATWGLPGQVLGFVMAPEDSIVSVWAACSAWVLGATLYTVLYSGRNAPTADRQAIRDARRTGLRFN